MFIQLEVLSNNYNIVISGYVYDTSHTCEVLRTAKVAIIYRSQLSNKLTLTLLYSSPRLRQLQRKIAVIVYALIHVS